MENPEVPGWLGISRERIEREFEATEKATNETLCAYRSRLQLIQKSMVRIFGQDRMWCPPPSTAAVVDGSTAAGDEVMATARRLRQEVSSLQKDLARGSRVTGRRLQELEVEEAEAEEYLEKFAVANAELLRSASGGSGRDKRRTTRGWTTPSTKTKTKGTSGGRQILQEPDKNDGGHHDHCRHHHDAITSTSTTKEEISDVVGGPATPDNVGDPRAGKSNVVEVVGNVGEAVVPVVLNNGRRPPTENNAGDEETVSGAGDDGDDGGDHRDPHSGRSQSGRPQQTADHVSSAQSSEAELTQTDEVRHRVWSGQDERIFLSELHALLNNSRKNTNPNPTGSKQDRTWGGPRIPPDGDAAATPIKDRQVQNGGEAFARWWRAQEATEGGLREQFLRTVWSKTSGQVPSLDHVEVRMEAWLRKQARIRSNKVKISQWKAKLAADQDGAKPDQVGDPDLQECSNGLKGTEGNSGGVGGIVTDPRIIAAAVKPCNRRKREKLQEWQEVKEMKKNLGKTDLLIRQVLQTLVDRKQRRPSLRAGGVGGGPDVPPDPGRGTCGSNGVRISGGPPTTLASTDEQKIDAKSAAELVRSFRLRDREFVRERIRLRSSRRSKLSVAPHPNLDLHKRQQVLGVECIKKYLDSTESSSAKSRESADKNRTGGFPCNRPGGNKIFASIDQVGKLKVPCWRAAIAVS